MTEIIIGNNIPLWWETGGVHERLVVLEYDVNVFGHLTSEFELWCRDNDIALPIVNVIETMGFNGLHSDQIQIATAASTKGTISLIFESDADAVAFKLSEWI